VIRKIERGKHIAASCDWVDFAVNNVDIVTDLNHSPLQIKYISPDKHNGKIYGINLQIEYINRQRSNKRGCIKVLFDIRLPISLGRTYATASFTYCAIDHHTTSLELKIELEAVGLMSIYARMRRRRIKDYIDGICADIENAARILSAKDGETETHLDESQKKRVAEYRTYITDLPTIDFSTPPKIEASLNVSRAKDIVLVEVDAVMPDKHLVTAKNEVLINERDYSIAQAKAKQLACINNPAFAARGEVLSENSDIEFHQAAFEFGHNLYRKYFSENLTNVMPVLLHHGNETSLRFHVDEHLQSLPWEALHDGEHFIVTKLRFSRSLGTTRQNKGKSDSDIAQFGILLIAPDSRGDLPGTMTEIHAIEELLSGERASNVELLDGSRASRRNVLDAMRTGEFNVLHFSGHSIFNSDSPYQSYLELAQNTRLSLHEFDNLVDSDGNRKPLSLVFLNSCQSGRVGIDKTSGRNLSMCRTFRESGVDNVIGMLWNVSDEATAQVAATFYKFLTSGQCIDVAEAMRKTRCKVAMERAWHDGSWLAPVLYT